MEWTHYGPNAVLVRFADKIGDEAFKRGRAIAAELERNPPAGLREFVPAYTTVLLEFNPVDVPRVEAVVHDLIDQLEVAMAAKLPLAPVKEIPIVYDGEDIERVASLNKLTVGEVRQLHAAPIYKVYMLGFMPGFPYMGDLDRRLHTPRLAAPRVRVPAGAVAIGGEHTGIYSVDSPGGWNIIGHTKVKMFIPPKTDDAPPGDAFALKQGDRVKFVPQKS
jgi:inhibitor of KinA